MDSDEAIEAAISVLALLSKGISVTTMAAMAVIVTMVMIQTGVILLIVIPYAFGWALQNRERIRSRMQKYAADERQAELPSVTFQSGDDDSPSAVAEEAQ